MNGNEPLGQAIETMEALFQLLHGGLREPDPLMIGLGHQLDDRLFGPPGQGFGEVADGVQTVQQTSVPMLLQAAPHSFNRVVLAVIRWIVSQLDRELVLVRELGDPGHELRTTAVILRSIVQVDEQGVDMGEAWLDGAPEVFQAIDDAITGQGRGGHIQEQLPLCWEIDAEGRHFVLWLKIVVQRFDDHACGAAAGKCPHPDRGFGIDRDAQDALCSRRLGVQLF